MKKVHEIERMSPIQRRRFLKGMAGVLAAMGADSALRFAFDEVGGGVAHAQAQAAAKPTYLIEIDLRDQWDQGHVMVAPGLATNGGLRRGTDANQAALFYGAGELKKTTINGTDVYLTNDSAALQPHLANLAVIDCCEVAVGDPHGHEAANPIRSPGRSDSEAGGKLSMWDLDLNSGFPISAGRYYSSTPTPATLHNYRQKQLDPGLRNGFVFKGNCRDFTSYHFAAGLPNANLDRLQSIDAIYSAFPDKVEDFRVLDSAEQAEAFVRVLDRVDRSFLLRRRVAQAAQDSHIAMVAESRKSLHLANPRLISGRLTPAEVAFWQPGVPNQVVIAKEGTVPMKSQIWESMGIATKLVTNDLVRSVAIEFDYIDHHGPRGENVLRTMAQQIAIPLARMIQKLKEANIFDKTVIAVFCTDGSREVKADSYGNLGKNTVMLAGGKIRGGYFSDIRVASNAGSGHEYTYHAPDGTTGAPGPGFSDNNGRLASNRLWRTIMKALDVPDALCNRFPDVAGAAPLPFLLSA